MNAAKGKIARIPFEIRQQMNLRIRDGVAGPALLAWLNSLPEVSAAIAGAGFGGGKAVRAEVSDKNLSEYCRPGGPYEAWLREQEKVDRLKTLAEYTQRMAEAAGGDVSGPAVKIAVARMMDALDGATEADVMKISAALSALSSAETAATRARTDRERLAVQRGALALDQQKFERQTAELFLKWYADKRAQEIAEGKGDKAVKMDRLVQLMFGERPANT